MAVQFRKPVDDNVPWDQRLANYAGNKDAGKSEYQRALEVYRGKSSLGDAEGANAAKKWSEQVNTAIGGIGDNIVSNRTDQINKTTDTIGQKVNADPFQFKQSQTPFQYNAQTDESYQAALRQAQRGAQTATNNAMVGLGSRGIGNSSVAVDRANQIQQSAIGNVNDTILPQLMQQAYGRYQDQNNNDYRNQLANYQSGQDQLKNLTGYAGTLNGLNQQEVDNSYRDKAFGEQQKQNNIDLAKWGTQVYGYGAPKSDGGVFFDQYKGAQTLPVQQFQYGKEQDKIQNTRADRQIDITQQNADTSRGSLDWAKDSNNPDNQYKTQQTANIKAELDQIGKTKPITTQDAINVLNKSPFVTNDSSSGTTSIEKTGMVQAIAGLGVPDAQMDALFNYYGISQNEVQTIEKQLRSQSGN